jgi:hypothetical protein
MDGIGPKAGLWPIELVCPKPVISRRRTALVANPESIRDDAIQVTGASGNGPKAAATLKLRLPFSVVAMHAGMQ